MEYKIVVMSLIISIMVSSGLVSVVGINNGFGSSWQACSIYGSSFVESYDWFYAKEVTEIWNSYNTVKVIDGVLIIPYDYWICSGNCKSTFLIGMFNISDFSKINQKWIYTGNGLPTGDIDFAKYNNMLYLSAPYGSPTGVRIFLLDENLNPYKTYLISFDQDLIYYYEDFVFFGNKIIVYDMVSRIMAVFNPQFQLIGVKQLMEDAYFMKLLAYNDSMLIAYVSTRYEFGVIAFDSNLQPLWGYKIDGYGPDITSVSDNIYLFNNNRIVKIYPNGTIAWAKSISFTDLSSGKVVNPDIYHVLDYYGFTVAMAEVNGNIALLFFDNVGNFVEGKITFPERKSEIFRPWWEDTDLIVYNGSVILTIASNDGTLVIKEGLGTSESFMKRITRYYNVTVNDYSGPITPYVVSIENAQASVTVTEESTSQYIVGVDQITIGGTTYTVDVSIRTLSELYSRTCVPQEYSKPMYVAPPIITCSDMSLNKAFTWVIYDVWGLHYHSYLIDKNRLLMIDPIVRWDGSINAYKPIYNLYFIDTENYTMDIVKIEYPKVFALGNYIIGAVLNKDKIFLVAGLRNETYITEMTLNWDVIKTVRITRPHIYFVSRSVAEDMIIIYDKLGNYVFMVDTNLSSIKAFTQTQMLFIRYFNITNGNYLVVSMDYYHVYINYYSENLSQIWGYRIDGSNANIFAYHVYMGDYIYVLIADHSDKYKAIVMKFDYNGTLINTYVIEFTGDFEPWGIYEYGNYIVIYGYAYLDSPRGAVVVFNDNGIFIAKIYNPILSAHIITKLSDWNIDFVLVKETGEYILAQDAIYSPTIYPYYDTVLLIRDTISYNMTPTMMDASDLFVVYQNLPYEITEYQTPLTDISSQFNIVEDTVSPVITVVPYNDYYNAFESLAYGCLLYGINELPPVTSETTTTSPSFPMFEINVLNTLSTNQMLLVLLFLLFFIPITRVFGVSRALSIASTVCAVVSLMVGAYNVFSMFLVLSILGFALWQSGY
ncbi:MAG: hypothetical protein QW607_10590 [Desulfurococcaceae archaeon]